MSQWIESTGISILGGFDNLFITAYTYSITYITITLLLTDLWKLVHILDGCDKRISWWTTMILDQSLPGLVGFIVDSFSEKISNDRNKQSIVRENMMVIFRWIASYFRKNEEKNKSKLAEVKKDHVFHQQFFFRFFVIFSTISLNFYSSGRSFLLLQRWEPGSSHLSLVGHWLCLHAASLWDVLSAVEPPGLGREL